jgi:hypothetical protein
MSKLCKGAEFYNPRQTSSHQRIRDGFVDDVTTFFNFGLAPMPQHNAGPGELASGLHREAQTWERLVCSTGGQLELPKCLCCLMIFDSKPDGTPTLLKAADMGTDLTRMSTGTSTARTETEHRDCSKAHRTLGLHPAPCPDGLPTNSSHGTPHEERSIRERPCPSSLQPMRSSHCLLNDVAPEHGALSPVQLHDQTAIAPCPEEDDLDQPLEVGLQLQNCPRRRFLGIGDRHLCYEQGIDATLQLLKHIRANSKLGDFLKIGLDWTQLHAGVSFPILETTRRALPHLDHGWFVST